MGEADTFVVGEGGGVLEKDPKRITRMSLHTGGASRLRMRCYVTGSCDALFGGGIN